MYSTSHLTSSEGKPMLLEAKNVSKYFGPRPVLVGFSLAMEAGENVALLGVTGSGKSTALRILSGFIAPNHGLVRFNGKNPRRPDGRERFAYLPEKSPLPDHMRVDEYLRFRAKIKGLHRRVAAERIDACAARCGVAGILNRLIGKLPRLSRRLVGLADCLLAEPALVMLDSPTLGLPPAEAAVVRDLVAAIETETALLLASNSIEDVQSLCSRVAVMDQGRVAIDGDLADICRRHVEEWNIVVDITAREPVREALRAVTGVKAVVAESQADDPQTQRMRLTVPAGVDLRREVADLANKREWLVTAIRLEPVRLEDLFRRRTG